ncbi:hypothetical protein EYF80_043288 [Liparis tanakae]|uniref:Uncharacterized protein n=1 Tax=Liparis tanakae TaxID=230148 RepID=A0A4Z2G110_9TELE|nr:hypothetical protein EYF80_043288 [Liparis tanakae]
MLSWLCSSISLITCGFRPPYSWLQCCRLFLRHRWVLSLSLLTPNQSAVPLGRGRILRAPGGVPGLGHTFGGQGGPRSCKCSIASILSPLTPPTRSAQRYN